MTEPGLIARIKVVMDEVKPVVMRRLEIPLALRLDRLHTTLQVAIGWTDSHLYEFRIKSIGFGIPDPDLGYRRWPARCAQDQADRCAGGHRRKILQISL